MVPLGPLGVLPTFYPSAIASLGLPSASASLGVSIPRRRQSSASAVGTFGAPHDADRLQHNAPWCQQSQHLAPTVPATFGISYTSAPGFLGVGIVRISRRWHCSASAVWTFGAPHDANWLQHNVPWYQSRRLAPTAPATFGISYPSASGFLGVGIVSNPRHLTQSRPVNKMTHYSLKERD
ncbi:hypothetical protein B0H34DRAFT_812197 [Crassisporium funariophilum]|nr:hypothetical protein B0H34DRAFT_812197 [Crassisporium funariophilum]